MKPTPRVLRGDPSARLPGGLVLPRLDTVLVGQDIVTPREVHVLRHAIKPILRVLLVIDRDVAPGVLYALLATAGVEIAPPKDLIGFYWASGVYNKKARER